MGDKWEPGWKVTGKFEFHIKEPKRYQQPIESLKIFHTGTQYGLIQKKKRVRNINILNTCLLRDF